MNQPRIPSLPPPAGEVSFRLVSLKVEGGVTPCIVNHRTPASNHPPHFSLPMPASPALTSRKP